MRERQWKNYHANNLGWGTRSAASPAGYIIPCDDHILEAFGVMFRKIVVASEEQTKKSPQR